MSYTIYPVASTPAAMIAKWPKAAMYTVDAIDFYVFGETLKDVTGEEDITIVDLRSKGVNHKFVDGAPGLTLAQLKSNFKSRLNQGEACRLTLEQGRHMWENEWKPNQTEEI
jgi:hypothetical protein